MKTTYDYFMYALVGFLTLCTIMYWVAILHDTPSACWFSSAPFTCARSFQLETIIKEQQ